MKIISFTAENIKRLTVVQITPDGNVVEITGKNEQGKTSVLDALWWGLQGTANIQKAPIREGAESAVIKLDMGEVKVTRKFRRKDGGDYTTSLLVTNRKFQRQESPQAFLDALFGELTFDPLEFTRLGKKQQFNALRAFVPAVDFDAVDAANKADYDARTELGRKAKSDRAAAGVIVISDDAPTEPVDESALLIELGAAAQHNADIETERAKRQTDRNAVDDARIEANRLRDQAGELRAQAEGLITQADTMDAVTASNETALDAVAPLPLAIDAEAITMRIENARIDNRTIERAGEKRDMIASAEATEAEAEALTAAMETRAAEVREAIAAVELPVPNISFGNDEILLDDLPFEQASDAVQLRTSLAIAMAANPTLRVIRVRDGSLLDEDAMQMLADAADANDYQIWIERVDNTGEVGFVLEDGHIKSNG